MSELLGELRLPSIPTLVMYAATLAAELPVICARVLIAYVACGLLLAIKGEDPGSAEALLWLAVAPTDRATHRPAPQNQHGWRT